MSVADGIRARLSVVRPRLLQVVEPRSAAPVESPPRDAVIAAAQFLRAHMHEPVSVQDVADHVGYSPFHLSRLFSNTMGQSPVQYLAAQRFHAAKELLLKDSSSVLDICMAVGFSSVGTFTRRFTAEVTTSPREFRRLPDLLADRQVRPFSAIGDGPGTVHGRVVLSPEAVALVGATPHVYVGAYAARAARGSPVAGSMLLSPGEFVLTGIPPGTWFVLAAAVPSDDLHAQLLVHDRVTGGYPAPIVIPAQRDAREPVTPTYTVTVTPSEDWTVPVTVALPSLQD